MKLPESFIQRMITHAHKEAPKECCGIIASKDGVAVKLYKARNVSEDLHQYIIHPTDLKRIYTDLEKNGFGIFATYHSHPRTEAYPSGDDVEMAVGASCPYVIISIKDPDCAEVRSFTIDRGGITEDLVESA